MDLQIFQVDAFTSQAFGGNPAAVVPLKDWLPDEVMLNIAAENNLAETAFFVKGEAGYDLRWFTPKVEINLCGHATLASAYVLFNELGYGADVIRFHSHKSGELSVSRDGGRFVLDFPAYPVTEVEHSDVVADAIGTVPMKVYETQGNMIMLRVES